MNYGQCPENQVPFHTRSTQQEIAQMSDMFSPTGYAQFGLAEGWHLGRACRRRRTVFVLISIRHVFGSAISMKEWKAVYRPAV